MRETLTARFPGAITDSSALSIPLLLLLILFCMNPTSRADGLTEYQIKAAFLFNFTKFVEWPADAFSDASAPIVIAVVGDNPFEDYLSATAAGKSIDGRAVVVKVFQEGQDVRGCTILFISSSEKKHTAKIIHSLKGSSVLTVSEIPGFARSGGMIGFLVEENKVRLEIDLAATAEARLKVSAKLIGAARVVAREPVRKS